jgi:hypothetical protein
VEEGVDVVAVVAHVKGALVAFVVAVAGLEAVATVEEAVDCMYSSHANEAQAKDKDFPVPVGDSKRRTLVGVAIGVAVVIGGRGRIPSNKV